MTLHQFTKYGFINKYGHDLLLTEKVDSRGNSEYALNTTCLRHEGLNHGVWSCDNVLDLLHILYYGGDGTEVYPFMGADRGIPVEIITTVGTSPTGIAVQDNEEGPPLYKKVEYLYLHTPKALTVTPVPATYVVIPDSSNRDYEVGCSYYYMGKQYTCIAVCPEVVMKPHPITKV